MATKLFVGNLPYTAAEEELRTLFDQSGTVASCEIVLDRFTGRARGFAFIEMASQEDADRAVEQFNEYDFEGRKLIVNEARPLEPRGAGGFSGRPAAGGGPGGGKRKSGKGSRRGARNAKRERKGFW